MFSVTYTVQGKQEGCMTYDEIVIEVSKRLGLSKELVNKTYKAYWKSVKEHIASLPLKKDLSDEEFMKLQPNVNIPSLGKFCVTLDRYKAMTKAFKNKIKIKEKQDVTCNKD